MKKKSIFLLFCFLSLFTPALYSQDIPEQPENGGETTTEQNQDEQANAADTTEEKKELSPEKQRIEMEIKTSTLPELAVWSRTLGLSESGTREELSRRIRQHYELPQPRPGANANRKEITIESAQVSEYFKIEVTGEDYARLSGKVKLSLKDNDAIHKITAEEILFNRTRNLLTARGNVEYIKEQGDTIEIFRGQDITVNIDDWASVFLAGSTEHKLESEGTSYLFSGSVISRTNDDVTILNNARITNAANEEALWSVNASKLWLLPGSDFAFFNAVLKAGEIPLLYIPFFYFPADEMIFHPVIGYRNREGGFVQTTTYILGRPKINPEETSSITKILGNSNNMEKEPNGLFLRSTGRKIVNPDTLTLRALADYYTNLGAYLALELSVPKTGLLNQSDFSIGFGITRTISQTSFGYSPFAPDYDGGSDWNQSNMFSMSVPFRYRMELKGSVNALTYGGLSWNFPYYSDPYVNIDFMERSESMDWFNMMQQGASSSGETSAENEINSFKWNLNGNINPSFPSFSPYISKITISNISTTLDFKTIRDNEIYNKNRYAPGRLFYAPDKYSIYSLSGSISGNPFTIGGVNADSSGRTKTQVDDLLKDIGNPVSPWANEGRQAEKEAPEEKLVPPVLSQSFELPVAGNIKFEIDYQISPTGTSELQFMNGSWQTFSQADWSEVQSILTSFAGNGSLNFRLNHSRNMFSNVVTFSGKGTWVDYSYLNEEAGIFKDSAGEIDQNKIEAVRRQQYSQTNYSTSYAYNGTLRPFYQNQVFGNSNLHYNFGGTLVSSGRYTNGNGPELRPQWGAWVKQDLTDGKNIFGVTGHRLATNFAANVMDKQQDISVSTDIPPLDALIITNATFRFWVSETNLNFRIARQEQKQPVITEEVYEKYKWVYEPIYFTQTLSFGSTGKFIYYMVLKPEENNEITTITSTLSFGGLGASFKALKSFKYNFVPNASGNQSQGGRWEQNNESILRPNELSIFYKHKFSDIEIIKNYLNFSIDLDTALTYNLLQYTSSNFQFQMGFNLGITNFMDINLSASSENNVVFRYLKGVPGMGSLTSMYIDGPQNNLLVDLLDSFNFFDRSKRFRSGFKMKRFDLKAIHYLGDWKAEFGITMYPYLNTSQKIPRYEVTADVSFIVQWKPISEIKTNIEYKGETDRWIKK
jgi:hypothetical protein